MQLYNEIQLDLEQNLSAKRYHHTIGVMYTAAALAMRYNEDVEKAMLAGLLHDCARQLSFKDMLNLCNQQDLSLSLQEQKMPELLHAKAGAVLATVKYGVNDVRILEAIRCHTTGKPGMNMLDKIVFLSDYIEPGRQILGLDTIRTLVFTNLDQGLLSVLKNSLNYLEQTQSNIDPMTMQTYQYYKNKKKETVL